MSAVDINFYEKKKSQTFYVAIALFVFVTFVTGGLYYYSFSQEALLEENEITLSQMQKSISDIEQDNAVEIYSIFAENKVLFSQLANGSRIPSMINHLKRVFTIQEVSYSGFSYNNGSAVVELSLETNDAGYAYEKVTKFLKNYRENEEALFYIDQIESFTGYDRMNFTADLTLKQ